MESCCDDSQDEKAAQRGSFRDAHPDVRGHSRGDPGKKLRSFKSEKKHINIKKYPPNPPQLGSDPKILYVGVLFLENKAEEAPPHKELGLSNLYAGDPFNSLCGYSLCAFFAPQSWPSKPWKNKLSVRTSMTRRCGCPRP